ncbi:MAG: hypothetical protein ACT4TC_14035 [Myxococcaceae bacterium]
MARLWVREAQKTEDIHPDIDVDFLLRQVVGALLPCRPPDRARGAGEADYFEPSARRERFCQTQERRAFGHGAELLDSLLDDAQVKR